ncbi:MAG: hypothetical protein M1822_007129 [Bathelium mastoideum]|nr:MAG: hypothetical protein M1822_007129 [Bathelium mastoideum]
MPHKHSRSRKRDETDFDLPPDRGTVLGASNRAHTNLSKSSERKRKRKALRSAGYGEDDTPRDFARLMQFQKGKRKLEGLDDGPAEKTKRLKQSQQSRSETNALSEIDVPKILPYERLSDFAARVDQSIPVAGLTRRGKGLGEASSRKEKRMQNMYADWRRQDAARRRREEEAREIAEEEAEELEEKIHASSGYTFDHGKKAKVRYGENDGGEEDDPWATLKERRGQPAGLHDVAQAPPSFKAIPRDKFKIKNGAHVQVDNVPNSAGSLRQREELGEERKAVIERYRKMMGVRKNK